MEALSYGIQEAFRKLGIYMKMAFYFPLMIYARNIQSPPKKFFLLNFFTVKKLHAIKRGTDKLYTIFSKLEEITWKLRRKGAYTVSMHYNLMVKYITESTLDKYNA